MSRRTKGSSKRRKRQSSDEDDDGDDDEDLSEGDEARTSSPLRSLPARSGSESGGEDGETKSSDEKDLGRGARTRAKVSDI